MSLPSRAAIPISGPAGPQLSAREIALGLTAALALTSVGIGARKVREVRLENGRLGDEARECRVQKAAFLDLIRAAGEASAARMAVDVEGEDQ